jgi:2-polyprenyl-3-methyl-5-hydroxy-6-metoxy-1,4-benzoquinol methylase
MNEADHAISADKPSLENTGERMIPAQSDVITFWEHVHRYKFSASFVPGKDVLDIACGEGYGSAALLKAGAKSVIGVDISADSCAHAREKYQIDARVGDAAELDLPAHSRDVIVSFETIEHVPEPEKFLTECQRILRPDGLLIISTPNSKVYNEKSPNNPYHCSEMSEAVFTETLSRYFSLQSVYEQTVDDVPYERVNRMLRKLSWRLAAFFERHFRQFACPNVYEVLTPELREQVIPLILSKPRPLEGALDRFAVRRRETNVSLNGMFLIALATPKPLAGVQS